MTNITIHSSMNSSILDDLETLDLDAVTAPSFSTSAITGNVGGIFVRISGSFAYSGNELTSGTVTGLSVNYYGSPLVSVSDVRLDIYDLAYGSEAAIMEAVLGGSDTILSYWAQGETYHTLGGNDRITLGAGNDVVDGGSGTDTFVLATAFEPGKIKLSGNALVIDSAKGKDTLTNVEIVEFLGTKVSFQIGSNGGDTLRGDANAGVDNDFLYGRGGDDTISGGNGSDRLFGNGGADRLYGEYGNDRLLGGFGKDVLNGGRDDDRLFGQRGNDMLKGSDGNDRLNGGGGSDTLIGHTGNDVLTGGAGRDVFVFEKGYGRDRITDFQIGLDTIEIGSGATGMGDLEFTRKGADVLLSFADVTVLAENITVADLRDADNFDF